jgi:transposase
MVCKKKIPVRIDVRTGKVEDSKRMRLCPHVIRLSTLRKRYRITLPLNPAKYHLEILRKGRIVDFQLVKKNRWFYAHICIKYEVHLLPVRSVMGVDIGVKRAMATVLLRPNQPLRREDLTIITDGEEKNRLNELNSRVAELQKARKWKPLKRLRPRRSNTAKCFDRLHAVEIAEMASVEYAAVAVGYPKAIKYENYRGNGKPSLRQMLQKRFAYGRRIRYIVEACCEGGVVVEPVPEAWTSQRCHRCGFTDTQRPYQSLFSCSKCGLQYNADWNAAINIGSGFFATRLSQWAREGLAYAGDELTYKPVSPEVRERAVAIVSTPRILGQPQRWRITVQQSRH